MGDHSSSGSVENGGLAAALTSTVKGLLSTTASLPFVSFLISSFSDRLESDF